MPNTVRLHRVLATKPDKVYRAFIEADAMVKWLPPNGFACTVHHLDAKVGGTFRMSFRNFTTGTSHSFGGQYLELVPGERLRYTDKFESQSAGRNPGDGGAQAKATAEADSAEDAISAERLQRAGGANERKPRTCRCFKV